MLESWNSHESLSSIALSVLFVGHLVIGGAMVGNHPIKMSFMNPKFFWPFTFFVWAFGAFVTFCPLAKGQDVMAPVYSAQAGVDTIDACPEGRHHRLWLIVNPNSGPGDRIDKGIDNLLARAESRKVNVLFYIDRLAHPGDGLEPNRSGGPRVKRFDELVGERQRYTDYYRRRKWAGWFFDDVADNMDHTGLDAWPGVKVLNPGKPQKFEPKLPGAIVVISETAGEWPRKLTDWEAKNKSRCVVMGLKIPQGSLPAFISSTAGLGFRWASPLDDQWTKGQTAYFTATPYLKQLLP